MAAQFFDRQDPTNPLNGTTVPDERMLDEVLGPLRKREPSFCELLDGNGFRLLIGIGLDIGCAQYGPADGDLPYLMAITIDPPERDGYAEFLAADTPTPIPLRYCLSFQAVRNIAAEFVRTGERSRSVGWEEV